MSSHARVGLHAHAVTHTRKLTLIQTHTHTFTRTHARTHAHGHHARIYMCGHGHARGHTDKHARSHERGHARTHADMHARGHAHTRARMNAQGRVHTRARTHTGAGSRTRAVVVVCRPCITATSVGLRAIRRTCVASLVFRQYVETNVNATVFRAGLRLSLSNYCLQHTSTIAVYMRQSGHH